MCMDEAKDNFKKKKILFQKKKKKQIREKQTSSVDTIKLAK